MRTGSGRGESRPESFAIRRVRAYGVILSAATLITLLAAAFASALVIFSAQALPLATRHDLASAQGTELVFSGNVDPGEFAAVNTALIQAVSQALDGAPVSVVRGEWSDPLGLVPGELPRAPADSTTPILEAAALSDVTSHAVLVSGAWPTAPSDGQPIQTALPQAAAALLHVTTGDLLRLKDRNNGKLEAFRISGLFAPRDHNGDAYWNLNTISASGSSTTGGFTSYGPLVVSSAAFASRLAYASGSWVAQPDMAALGSRDMATIAASVSALSGSISNNSLLGGLDLTTSLPSVLSGTASDLSVARSLLGIGAVQLLLLAAAALIAVARLLASQRESEVALLGARGATRTQLARLTAIEVVPLCAAAAVAGGIAGIWLADLLASAGALRAANLGMPGIGTATLGDALTAAGGTALVCVLLLLIPVFRVVMPGTVRTTRGRQAALAGVSRAGLDIALIALAVLAGWQLRRYSASPATGTDPVLVLAPALALAGGAVLMLRLLPAAAKAGERLAARGRGLVAALASWQFARQPVRQGGPALLIVLAAASGTLALSQHASWARSAADQAAFTAGSDLRADSPIQPTPAQAAGVTRVPGVTHAMAASVLTTSGVLAINATQAPKVVLTRAGEVASGVFGKITPASVPGITLSGPQLTLAATLTGNLTPVDLAVTVMDTQGNAYQFGAGTLPADGRTHQIIVPTGMSDAKLIAISATYTLPVRSEPKAHLVVTADGSTLGSWSAVVSSPELASLVQTQNQVTAHGEPTTVTFGNGKLAFDAGYGQEASVGYTSSGSITGVIYQALQGQIQLTAARPDTLAAIPAIATTSYLHANSLHIGSTQEVTVNGIQVPVEIGATATEFPTVSASGGALIVDLPALQEYLATQAGTPVPVTEWWLTSRDDASAASAVADALPAGTVITSRTALADAITQDPVSLAPQQALLATAATAALLAIAGFAVSIATSIRQRRAESALLAALGVGPQTTAWQLCLEKLMLSLPSAALGLVLGAVLARLLVPAVTLTTTAATPVPPPVTMLNLAYSVPLALVIAIAPTLVAGAALARRPDPAAELRAAEAGT